MEMNEVIRQLCERKNPARFGRRFLVQENSYHRMDAEELKQMRSARQQQGSRESKGALLEAEALLKRKWEAAVSREINRSAAGMISIWGRGNA